MLFSPLSSHPATSEPAKVNVPCKLPARKRFRWTAVADIFLLKVLVANKNIFSQPVGDESWQSISCLLTETFGSEDLEVSTRAVRTHDFTLMEDFIKKDRAERKK